MPESGGRDGTQLWLAPRLAQAASALTLLLVLSGALGFDLTSVLALDLKRPAFWLWQLFSSSLIQLPGNTGIVGQALICIGVYFVVAELERDLGTKRSASLLLTSVVGTALLTLFVAKSTGALGRVAGAEGMLLAALSAYAWLHPERPLPFADAEGVRRTTVVLGLLLACAVMYSIDGHRLSLIARLCAIVVGIFAWRVDLTPIFDRVVSSELSRRAVMRAPRLAQDAADAAARVLRDRPHEALHARLRARWTAVVKQLRGELSSAPADAQTVEAPVTGVSRYWSEVELALPLKSIEALRKED